MEEGPEEGARPTCTHTICAVELTAVEANFPLIDHLIGPNEAYLKFICEQTVLDPRSHNCAAGLSSVLSVLAHLCLRATNP